MNVETSRFDVVVIGAGHNGLTAACMLARRGRRVLVVERRDIAGGICAGEEFHPGFRSPGLLHDTTCVRTGVIDSLNLVEHGLEFDPEPPAIFLPQQDGKGLLLSHDPARSASEIAAHSPRDSERYADFHGWIDRIRPVVAPLVNEVPPDIFDLSPSTLPGLAARGLSLRRLGSKTMMELLRVPPMCVADWTREWFETELLCAGMAHVAIAGTWAGPWSPGTAANLLLWACTTGKTIRGGAAALANALSRAAEFYGVDVRTGAGVTRILVDQEIARGVELEGGETIVANTVISSCDPKTTFLRLLDAGDVSHGLERHISMYRTRGTTAKVHFAIRGKLAFTGRPEGNFSRAFTGESLDDQERAFDAVKYGHFSERPVLDIFVPTVDRKETAPDGHSVVSVLAHFAPFELQEGWDGDARERLGDTVAAELERFAPGVGANVVAREVLSPADIETRYGMTGGHVHHGEHALDQLVCRPTLETARYATPIKNLFLCGSGSHPGGGITCAPGAIAAGVVARTSVAT